LPPARSGAHRAASDHHAGDGIDPFEPGIPAALATGPSLWGDDATHLDAATADLLDPTVLFHRARAALETGQSSEAATGLILALRASPGLAPAILDLLAGRSEPILTLVRGDAQRIVGREVEAMRDHAAAAGSLGAGEASEFQAAEAEAEAEANAEAQAESGVEADEAAEAAEARVDSAAARVDSADPDEPSTTSVQEHP
jgi:hypothetical protein